MEKRRKKLLKNIVKRNGIKLSKRDKKSYEGWGKRIQTGWETFQVLCGRWKKGFTEDRPDNGPRITIRDDFWSTREKVDMHDGKDALDVFSVLNKHWYSLYAPSPPGWWNKAPTFHCLPSFNPRSACQYRDKLVVKCARQHGVNMDMLCSVYAWMPRMLAAWRDWKFLCINESARNPTFTEEIEHKDFCSHVRSILKKSGIKYPKNKKRDEDIKRDTVETDEAVAEEQHTNQEETHPHDSTEDGEAAAVPRKRKEKRLGLCVRVRVDYFEGHTNDCSEKPVSEVNRDKLDSVLKSEKTQNRKKRNAERRTGREALNNNDSSHVLSEDQIKTELVDANQGTNGVQGISATTTNKNDVRNESSRIKKSLKTKKEKRKRRSPKQHRDNEDDSEVEGERRLSLKEIRKPSENIPDVDVKKSSETRIPTVHISLKHGSCTANNSAESLLKKNGSRTLESPTQSMIGNDVGSTVNCSKNIPGNNGGSAVKGGVENIKEINGNNSVKDRAENITGITRASAVNDRAKNTKGKNVTSVENDRVESIGRKNEGRPQKDSAETTGITSLQRDSSVNIEGNNENGPVKGSADNIDRKNGSRSIKSPSVNIPGKTFSARRRKAPSGSAMKNESEHKADTHNVRRPEKNTSKTCSIL